ncbi:DUF2020 domain-containing protein [Amycolatopsis arida]|uniref:DUF2020 domain-containing protein n=1 Tax=Amycolatopsis arida TaxID=587909 RepID=UPI000B87119C|nr:DUF2020 domain-containing protein [Amycolatopsis arida]
MRRLSLPAVAVAGLLAACTPTENPPPAPEPPRTAAPPQLPPDPEPVADGPCPYLTADFVGQANGQRVGNVRTSADEPHPTCFFYRPDGSVQLTVRVYVGEPGVARALVDHAAPVDTANPADEPPGWQGGYQKTEEGAVYAVAKGGAAVVVTTNQQQSVKAREVATEAISALKI